MKTKTLLLVSTFLFLACSNKDDSSGAPPSSQNISAGSGKIYGTWIYEYPNSTASNIHGMGAVLGDDGSITILNMYIKPGTNSATYIFRRSTGTFKQEGDLMHLKYSYETCNPVGSETLLVKQDPQNADRLFVSNEEKTVMFTMHRSKSTQSDLMMTMVEDKNCNLISKTWNKDRKPASIKSVLEFSKP